MDRRRAVSCAPWSRNVLVRLFGETNPQPVRPVDLILS